jgi:hypothetical protein
MSCKVHSKKAVGSHMFVTGLYGQKIGGISATSH